MLSKLIKIKTISIKTCRLRTSEASERCERTIHFLPENCYMKTINSLYERNIREGLTKEIHVKP